MEEYMGKIKKKSSEYKYTFYITWEQFDDATPSGWCSYSEHIRSDNIYQACYYARMMVSGRSGMGYKNLKIETKEGMVSIEKLIK